MTTLSIGLRSRAPMLAACLVSTGYALFELSTQSGRALVEPAALVFVFYRVGQRSIADRRSRLAAGLLLGASVGVAVLTADDRYALNQLSGWMLFVAAPAALGSALASRARLVRRLQATTARLARDGAADARRAAADERARIARELHDAVAHAVSVMVIQTVAARRVAATDRPASREALGVVETCGREALVEMRRVIGVLHRGDTDLSGIAAPTLAQLDQLVSRARSAGLTVSVEVAGQGRRLAADVDLIAFRVVQEALTNVIKHAGEVPVSITLRYRRRTLELDIANAAGTQPAATPTLGCGGHGLVGMEERLALYGGRLQAGQVDDGFRLHAWIPLDDPSPA
jgi:signal transduction histidine kinase